MLKGKQQNQNKLDIDLFKIKTNKIESSKDGFNPFRNIHSGEGVEKEYYLLLKNGVNLGKFKYLLKINNIYYFLQEKGKKIIIGKLLINNEALKKIKDNKGLNNLEDLIKSITKENIEKNNIINYETIDVIELGQKVNNVKIIDILGNTYKGNVNITKLYVGDFPLLKINLTTKDKKRRTFYAFLNVGTGEVIFNMLLPKENLSYNSQGFLQVSYLDEKEPVGYQEKYMTLVPYHTALDKEKKVNKIDGKINNILNINGKNIGIFKKGDVYGIVNLKTGEVITPPDKYSDIYTIKFDGEDQPIGIYAIYGKEGKGLLHLLTGKEISPAVFYDTYPSNNYRINGIIYGHKLDELKGKETYIQGKNIKEDVILFKINKKDGNVLAVKGVYDILEKYGLPHKYIMVYTKNGDRVNKWDNLGILDTETLDTLYEIDDVKDVHITYQVYPDDNDFNKNKFVIGYVPGVNRKNGWGDVIKVMFKDIDDTFITPNIEFYSFVDNESLQKEMIKNNMIIGYVLDDKGNKKLVIYDLKNQKEILNTYNIKYDSNSFASNGEMKLLSLTDGNKNYILFDIKNKRILFDINNTTEFNLLDDTLAMVRRGGLSINEIEKIVDGLSYADKHKKKKILSIINSTFNLVNLNTGKEILGKDVGYLSEIVQIDNNKYFEYINDKVENEKYLKNSKLGIIKIQQNNGTWGYQNKTNAIYSDLEILNKLDKKINNLMLYQKEEGGNYGLFDLNKFKELTKDVFSYIYPDRVGDYLIGEIKIGDEYDLVKINTKDSKAERLNISYKPSNDFTEQKFNVLNLGDGYVYIYTNDSIRTKKYVYDLTNMKIILEDIKSVVMLDNGYILYSDSGNIINNEYTNFYYLESNSGVMNIMDLNTKKNIFTNLKSLRYYNGKLLIGDEEKIEEENQVKSLYNLKGEKLLDNIVEIRQVGYNEETPEINGITFDKLIKFKDGKTGYYNFDKDKNSVLEF